MFTAPFTFGCANCGIEIYRFDTDPALICHNCGAQYGGHPKDQSCKGKFYQPKIGGVEFLSFPEPLRAKCFRCGTISDDIHGYRWENIDFKCSKCGWEWESSPW